MRQQLADVARLRQLVYLLACARGHPGVLGTVQEGGWVLELRVRSVAVKPFQVVGGVVHLLPQFQVQLQFQAQRVSLSCERGGNSAAITNQPILRVVDVEAKLVAGVEP